MCFVVFTIHNVGRSSYVEIKYELLVFMFILDNCINVHRISQSYLTILTVDKS